MRTSSLRLFFLKALVLPCFLLGLVTTNLQAGMRTLTDKQGRSIQAEVVAVDGDTVTIQREDGQTFTLSLSTLSDNDQRALRKWAAEEAAKPKPLPPGAITVQLSRGILKTDKRKVDVHLVGGGMVKNGMTVTEDQWGYDVTVTNTTSTPVKDLRAEYILFATVDNIQKTGDEGLKKRPFRSPVPAVPALDHIKFQTKTITAIKERYNGNIVAAGSGASSSRETLYGIWIRIYQGQDLVYEVSMPTTLQSTEKW